MLDLDTRKVSLINHKLPIPEPNSSEHLIKMHATALCARELLWPVYFPAPNPKKELVPGYDLAGTVVTAPASSPFQPGAEVYTRTNYLRAGNAREYSIALTEELALTPRNLSWEERATVPLSALTAWQGLFIHGKLGGIGDEATKGKRVLVTAASGGVGIWVVQLAKLAGCKVVGTCGTDNVEFVKSLGADEVVDYRTTNLREWAEADGSRKADVVIDCVGGKNLEMCWSCVKDNGILMSVVEPPDNKRPEDWQDRGVTASFWIMHPDGEQLAQITKLIGEGKCRPVLDSVYSMEDFEKAFERTDSGHAKGKVVLKIAE